MDFREFTKFDKMITPSFIKLLFWIGTVFSVLTGLAVMFDGGISIIMGLGMIIVGPIVTRIYCELLMVFFKINENLAEIISKIEKKQEDL